MGVNVTVRRRFVINGREYNSVEEMPPEIRAAVEKAMAQGAASHGKTTITVNGKEYDSIDDVPSEMRALVGDAEKIAAETAGTAAPTSRTTINPPAEQVAMDHPHPTPNAPGFEKSSASWWIVLALGILLAILIYMSIGR